MAAGGGGRMTILSSTELVKIPAMLQQYIPRKRFEGMTVQAEWMYDLDACAVRLKKYVWSERLADESVSWPTTWWDAFKARWFPRWALRRWPAKYSHADFRIYRGYPDLVLPDQKSVLFSLRHYDP